MNLIYNIHMPCIYIYKPICDLYIYIDKYILGGFAILTSPNHLWTFVVWLSWFALNKQELNMSDYYLLFMLLVWFFLCFGCVGRFKAQAESCLHFLDKRLTTVLANHVGSKDLVRKGNSCKSQTNYADSPTPVAPWYNPTGLRSSVQLNTSSQVDSEKLELTWINPSLRWLV